MPSRGSAAFVHRLAVITAALPRAVRALAYVGFEVRVIPLRIMAPQPSVDAAKIAFHDALTIGGSRYFTNQSGHWLGGNALATRRLMDSSPSSE